MICLLVVHILKPCSSLPSQSQDSRFFGALYPLLRLRRSLKFIRLGHSSFWISLDWGKGFVKRYRFMLRIRRFPSACFAFKYVWTIHHQNNVCEKRIVQPIKLDYKGCNVFHVPQTCGMCIPTWIQECTWIYIVSIHDLLYNLPNMWRRFSEGNWIAKKKKLSVGHSWVVNKPIYGSSVSMFNPKFQYAFQMSYSCKVGAASYNLVDKIAKDMLYLLTEWDKWQTWEYEVNLINSSSVTQWKDCCIFLAFAICMSVNKSI